VKLGEEPKSKSYSYTFNSSDWDDENGNVRVMMSGDKPYLGLRLIDLNDQLAAFLKMNEHDGAFVTEVIKDSPAEKAGLKAGDVIVSIDSEAVDSREELIDELGDYRKGDVVELGLIRDGKRQTVKATLDEGDRDFYWGDNVFTIPPIPDVDVNVPQPRGRYWGSFDRDDVFDSDELQDDMDELREELKALKKELQEQIRDWKKYKDEH